MDGLRDGVNLDAHAASEAPVELGEHSGGERKEELGAELVRGKGYVARLGLIDRGHDGRPPVRACPGVCLREPVFLFDPRQGV